MNRVHSGLTPSIPTAQTLGPVNYDRLRSVIYSATHFALPFADRPMKPLSVQERAAMQVEIADLVIADLAQGLADALAPDSVGMSEANAPNTPAQDGEKG